MAYKYYVKAYNPDYVNTSGDVAIWSVLPSDGFVSENWSDSAFGGKRFATPILSIVQEDSLLLDTIQISWVANSLATKFQIAYDTLANFTSSYSDVVSISNNTAKDSCSYNFVRSSLKQGKSYYFKLRLVNEGGASSIWDSISSDWSPVDSGWSKLKKAVNVIATDSITDSVLVAWDKSVVSGVTYEVKMMGENSSDQSEKNY